MIKEDFKELNDFIGLHKYKINSEGVIRNKITKAVKYLNTTKTGYSEVSAKCKSLGINRNKVLYKVHRLVAKLFIPNPNNLPEVNHKDGNKKNNCVSNLEWVSRLENMQHASKNNLLKSVEGSLNPNAKLDEDTVRNICDDYQNKMTINEVMTKYNITKNIAGKIFYRTSWIKISSNYKW